MPFVSFPPAFDVTQVLTIEYMDRNINIGKGHQQGEGSVAPVGVVVSKLTEHSLTFQIGTSDIQSAEHLRFDVPLFCFICIASNGNKPFVRHPW